MDRERVLALLELVDNVWRELDNAATKERTDTALDELEELAYVLRVRTRRYATDTEAATAAIR